MLDFVNQSATVAGGVLTWRVGGVGPALLYLHGAGGAQISTPLRRLTSDYRVYAPVIPGFDATAKIEGIASMPALAQLLGTFVTGEIRAPAIVIGHSFGGLVAMWLALTHPHLVLRLILGCPAGIVSGTPPHRGEDPDSIRRRLHLHPERRAPETRSPATLQTNRATCGHYYAGGAMAERLIANLDTIRCPTLILGGARDGIVPPETGRLLNARLPKAQLVWIDDAAHAIDSDQPDDYERIVRRFLCAEA